MATNRALRTALLTKMGWSKQTLSAKVQVKKRTSPMSTEEATYVIAHENGVKIDKYLPREQVAQVRVLFHQQADSSSPSARAGSALRPARKSEVREIRFPNEFKATNPLLSITKLKEAKEMAAIFPLLYVIENSMRELIRRVMKDKHGESWWETELTSGKVKNVYDKAADRMKTESQRKWHQRRGSHPIDYVDLGDLGTIIRGKQNDFIPKVIPDLDWFSHLMRELEPSRNVVCHMNPLDDVNTSDVKSWFSKWERTLANGLADGAIPKTPG